MLRLFGLVISIGLADSLNPTTIAPVLYLASTEQARREVAKFTLAVFTVYLLGGLLIILGPGELLLALVPHPGHRLSYLLELIAGVAMLIAGGFLWAYRNRLREREIKEVPTGGKSSALLGATITAVELPTAFPYFAAIAAIVPSGRSTAQQVVLLVTFNLCFVAPLLAILATLTFAGPNAQRWLASGRARLEARWPLVLAVLALAAGTFVTLLGLTGLAGMRPGRLGHIARHLRHLLRP